MIEPAVKRAAIEAGRQFAAQAPGGTSIASFAAIQPLWTQGDSLHIEPVKQDEVNVGVENPKALL